MAGRDLGGMNVDEWLAADFCSRHRIEPDDRRELEPLILRQAEAAKIQLSDPDEETAEMAVLNQLGAAPRLLRTIYSRTCGDCERGRPGRHDPVREGCLGCILLEKEFTAQVRETVERAVENATVKAGMRKSDITKVLVTGGASLIPAVRRLLGDAFGGRVVFDHPFDCVVRGACRGMVDPVLQHDYAIEGYNRDKKRLRVQALV